MTMLRFARDVQGLSADAPDFPTIIYTATLAANTAESLTIPSAYEKYVMYVRVQPTEYCWVANGHTAAIPAGGTLASSNSELVDGTIEYKRMVYATNVISFLTPAMTCDISVSLYPTPN